MRPNTTGSGRNAAYLDDMKKVTPSRATVENAIARARAKQAAKKPKAPSRNVVRPFVKTKKLSTLEPDESTRSVDRQPEPSPTKKPSSPTQEFFQNVFASRSTASPSNTLRGRGSGHSSRAMADPPTSSDPPTVDAPAFVAASKSADEEREDGNTVEAAPTRHTTGKGETVDSFQAEKLELESVAETQECEFGLEKRNLPSSPSMKSDCNEDREDDWELKGMASEETLKATGNARRTRPHKGIFVRKAKKKNTDDDEDGKVIKSLFSTDSSVAPVNALFDQESCFNEEDDDFDDEISEVQPRKADPPDSSPDELTGSDPAVSRAQEETDEDLDVKDAEVPWDKKGTSLGHVEKLVASIKATKAQQKAEPPAEKNENTPTKKASDSNTPKPGEVNEMSGDTSTKEVNDLPSPKEREESEESEEYEDFIGDFLQSGSGDDAAELVEAEVEMNAEAVDGTTGEVENKSLIVDEVEKCENQNTFLEQFEALGIEEESPQKKPAVEEEKEADETLNKSLDAISELKTRDKFSTEMDKESKKEEKKQEDEASQVQDHSTAKELLNDTKVQHENAAEKEEPQVETLNKLPSKIQVETVVSAEDSVESKDGNSNQQTSQRETAVTTSVMDDDTASSTSEVDEITKRRHELEMEEEEIPEEPVHIFKFAKGTSEEDWQEKNEMASEWQHKSSSIPLDGVAAAENLHRFTNRLNKEPEPRPWKISCKQRTRNHRGFKNIDIYSILESTTVTVGGQPRDDYIPWEHRNVKQRFLQERSVEFSRNWYGENQKNSVNSKFKLPVCRPRSMEMPIGTAEDAVEWNKDVYTTWKSPYQKIEHQRLKLTRSEDDEEKSKGSKSTKKVEKGEEQSHLVEKSDSGDDEEERSHDSEYDDEGSYSDGSYSDGSYTDSEGSYDDDDESFYDSVTSETGSALIVDDNGTVASWEDAPECGNIVNMRLRIGEHVTRVHPSYTSSLRRSRWRKKYFPKGSFPY